MRALLEHVFKGMDGIRISGTAKNTFEARLEMSRRRPDLVVLDEVLPGESSLDLLVELSGQEMPVVLMSSMETPSPQLPPGALARFRKPSWNQLDADRKRIQDVLIQAYRSRCK